MPPQGGHGYPRYVHDHNRVTGGGISSGLDEALALIELIAGTSVAQEVQVGTQYFPRPPVSGSIPGTDGCMFEGIAETIQQILTPTT